MLKDQYRFLYDSKSTENEVQGVVHDRENRKLPFVFRRGKNNFKKRLLIILHGHGANKNFAKYQHDEWDVLCPLDIYGRDGLGCWWLGEEGDFFVYNLLQTLINKVQKDNKHQEIFFWGSSMGGYGAILHGIAMKANAVYAHMPQVKLRGTEYTDGINKKYYEGIFAENKFYSDLINLIKKEADTSGPVFFLSQNIFDYPFYIEQHFLPLVNILLSKNMACEVSMNLKNGHVLHENIFETVENKFERQSQKILNWKLYGNIESPVNISKAKLEKKVKDELELEISMLTHSLVIMGSDFGGDYYYACYIYDGHELLIQTKYQKKPNFNLDIPTVLRDLKVKFYVQDIRDKVRVSKTYSYPQDKR